MTVLLKELTLHSCALVVFGAVVFLLKKPLAAFARRLVDITYGLSRNISGEWNATVSVGDCIYNQVVQVRQISDFVWGTIQCRTTGRRFRLLGRLTQHTLIGIYELLDRHRSTIDNGTFSLKLNDDGDILKGQLVCPAGSASFSSSSEYVWHRETLRRRARSYSKKAAA